MFVKEAERIVHSLSNPSKMPGYSYGLPVRACITGSKLREKEGTVCSKCYACKGHYKFSHTLKSQEARLASLKHSDWVEAMTTAIRGKRVPFFRWHDSGDLQGLWHLKKIIKVAEALPHVKFWLPTKEKKILMQYFSKHDYVPPNLCIRLSATLIDTVSVLSEPMKGRVQTCSVHKSDKAHGFPCGAYKRGGKCGDCRVCWDKAVPNVSYPEH